MTMDPKVDTNHQISKIRNQNKYPSDIAEYTHSSPNHKYTPPSPTTSGYSESGSEIDHDSGRVSEMENSPKSSKRTNAISLSMGLFNPSELNRTSPTEEVEGTSTIKTREVAFSKVTKKLSEDYALPLDAFARNGNSDQTEGRRSANIVEVDTEILRKLVLCVQDTQNRLAAAENKIEILTRALKIMQQSSNSKFTKLSRTLVALGSDFNQYKSSERKTLPGGIQTLQDHPPQNKPHVNRHQVPYSKNNNNIVRSFKSHGPRFRSNECLHSPEIGSYKITNTNKPSSEKCTATFPRAEAVRRNAKSNLTPPSSAPPTDNGEESYDNVTDDTAKGVDHHVTNSTILTGSYVNDKSVKSSQNENSTIPVYAVVRKKKGLSKNDSKDEQIESITLQETNVQEKTCNSESDDLDEMIKTLTKCNSSSSFINANHENSSKRLSRFSEVESLVSLLEQSPTHSEQRIGKNESAEEVLREQYDNKESDMFPREKMPKMDNKITISVPPSVANIYTRDPALHLRMVGTKDGEDDIDQSIDRSINQSSNPRHRDRFPSPVLRNESTWHDFEHHETPYAVIPNVKKANGPKNLGKRFSLRRGKSVDAIHENNDRSPPLNDTEKSRSKWTKKHKDKGSAEDKKSNILLSNYKRLFKRKHKSDDVSLHSFGESQDSFTFIVSPLYEKAEKRESKSKSFFGRNRSEGSSCVSREFDGSSSFSNLSSSREGSLDLINSQDQSQKKQRSTLVSSANIQLYRLQSPVKLPDFVPLKTECEFRSSLTHNEDSLLRSSYGSDARSDDDEMGPRLVKLAKETFKNSPKLPSQTKTNGYVVHSKCGESQIAKNYWPDSAKNSEVQIDAVDGVALYDVQKTMMLTPDGNSPDDVFIPPG